MNTLDVAPRENGPLVLAVTAGDVAGIGPEVVVRALARLRETDTRWIPLLIGHPRIFLDAAVLFDLTLPIQELHPESAGSADFRTLVESSHAGGWIACLNPSGDAVLQAPRRQVSAASGDAAYQYLSEAITLARQGLVAAIVTAPLNKEALHRAGHHFPGHTEILAEQCGVSEFAMMLHLPESAMSRWRPMVRMPGDEPQGSETDLHGLSIVHVTLHTSVQTVPGLLSVPAVEDSIRLMHGFLKRIGCRRTAIGVAALNPHGGEHGLFGDEEGRIIEPAVAQCRTSLRGLAGPLPVDTLVRRAVAGEFDGLVVMYHDQGHIPVKLIGFDRAVNITLGLPIIRTSPTHGTAFDRAWRRETPSDATGMTAAILTALQLAQVRPE